MKYSDMNILKVPSDICAEQIQTIDKCSLVNYCGNVGERVMKEVDHAGNRIKAVNKIIQVKELQMNACDIKQKIECEKKTENQQKAG